LETSEQTKKPEPIPPNNGALFKALAKAQGEFKEIKKNCKVDFKTKNGQRVNFKYADLKSIRDATTPALSKNGLAVFQIYESRQMAEGHYQTMLVTHLVHESGAAIQSELPIDVNIEVQEMGSLTTYYRRYQLAAILGVVADDDTDVQTVPQGRQQGHQNKPQPRPLPKPKDNPMTRAELGMMIMELARDQGITPPDLEKLVLDKFNVTQKELTNKQMEQLCKEIS